MSASFEKNPTASPEERAVWADVIKADPASPALLTLARACLNRFDAQQAHDLASRVAAAHPDNLTARLISAQALLDLGREEEARLALAAAEVAMLNTADLLDVMAGLMHRINEADSAMRYEAAAAQLRPAPAAEPVKQDAVPEKEPVLTETLASLYLSQGHRDRAIEIYEHLLVRDPGNISLAGKLMDLKSSGSGSADLPRESEADAGDAFWPEDLFEADDSVMKETAAGQDPETVRAAFEDASLALQDETTPESVEGAREKIDGPPANPVLEAKRSMARRLARLKAAAQKRRERRPATVVQG